MNREDLEAVLLHVCDRSLLTEFVSECPDKYSAVVYCKLDGTDDYDDQCTRFIDKFSTYTKTNWIALVKNSNPIRYLFRKTYLCHHSNRNKIKKPRVYLSQAIKGRDLDCTAEIDIRWKKLNRHTVRNDKYLLSGLNCVVYIDFNHNHPVGSADVSGFLRCSKETTKLFDSYFSIGLTPATAKAFHELYQSHNADDENSAEVNRQTNPLYRQVVHLYQMWKKKCHNESPINTLDIFLKRKEILEEKGYCVRINEETSDVAVVTPVMKKVFGQFCVSNNLFVYVDYSISIGKSSRKKLPTINIVVLFVPSKIGALPIACLHQSSDNHQSSWELLKATLHEATGVEFRPDVIATCERDDCRAALQTIFPEANIILSKTHLRQRVWKWMFRAKNMSQSGDHWDLIKNFNRIIYSETVEVAKKEYEELNKKIKSSPKVFNFFESWWSRPRDWHCKFSKSEWLSTDIDRNDCESSIRILRNMVLNRCQNFVLPAQVDIICNLLESYFEQRLVDYAIKQNNGISSHYSKYCKPMSGAYNVVKVGTNLYQISKTEPGNDNIVYTADTELELCDCKHGKDGRYCEHIVTLEKHLSIKPERPMFSDDINTSAKIVSNDEDATESLNCENQTVEELMTVEEFDFKDEPKFEVKCEPESDIEMKSEAEGVDGPAFTHVEVKSENFSILEARETASNIRRELNRIADLLEDAHLECPTTTTMAEFYNLLQNVKTPLQALDFAENNLKHKSPL